ncbi:acyl-CoA synthetase [Pseudomonas benzenivorans]|uniref:AMP-binding protein n=1 Tax=Pseudomonas benzenivorans TaxID=556533 RepID=A0ABY5H7P4_9PSED|nr:AMP-binding protein [Pseudomonas benzenivorans]UTW08138.1 AMP-binding protein [Pseudomonas benzenivorans]
MLIQPGVLSYERLFNDFVWDVPKHINIAELICDRHARTTPLGTAVIEDSERGVRRFTFAALKQLSDNLACRLRKLGINRGDRVVIILGQDVEALVSHLAIFKLGAISVPIAGLYTGDGLSFRINDCAASLVITDRSGADKLNGLDLPSVVHRAVIHQQAEGHELDFDELLLDSGDELEPVQTEANQPALIFYTSGTTGNPKGALHGHRIVNGHLPCFQLGFEMAPKNADVFWTASDWSWLGSLGDVVFPALYFGHPLVASPGRFSVRRSYQLMQRHRVTCPYLATAVLRKMRAERSNEKLELHVRAIMTGGEALAPEVLKWAQVIFNAPVNDEFGLTESNQTSVCCTSLYEAPANSVGRITPGKRVCIIDSEGQPLQPGVTGEIAIWYDDPTNMLGYWNQPQKTADRIINGWLRSGDRGMLDDQGYLYYYGRLDDLIMVNGLRVGPDEVENQLAAHDKVAEAGVIGVPDERSGEAIVAFVRLRDGIEADQRLKDELQAFVKQRLAAHCYPKFITFVRDFSVTSTGKIRRADLRKIYTEQFSGALAEPV